VGGSVSGDLGWLKRNRKIRSKIGCVWCPAQCNCPRGTYPSSEWDAASLTVGVRIVLAYGRWIGV